MAAPNASVRCFRHPSRLRHRYGCLARGAVYLAILAAVALAGCEHKAPPPAPPPPKVSVVTVQAQAVPITTELPGRVTGYRTADVRPQVNGIILKRLFVEGKDVKAGQQLYRGGDRARNIPACMACHGPVGRGNPAAGYPVLRAQHAVYTVAQLSDYAADKRYTRNDKGDSSGGPNAEIMHTIAGRLTQQDIRNLASYVQGMR